MDVEREVLHQRPIKHSAGILPLTAHYSSDYCQRLMQKEHENLPHIFGVCMPGRVSVEVGVGGHLKLSEISVFSVFSIVSELCCTSHQCNSHNSSSQTIILNALQRSFKRRWAVVRANIAAVRVT